MIYFLTVHFHSKKWIDVQLRFIKKCVEEPYRVLACLNGNAIAESYKFYYAEDIPGTHASKLNYLADKVVGEADDQDILVFIDGDAFPIRETIVSYIREKIRVHQLVAVRRDENLGDVQPHPSFCAVTVGLWKHLKGDWTPGYCWTNAQNKRITSVGGNLLRILNENGISWWAMTRSNKRNLHPLWFGVYDDIVYHHGAGFRSPVSRIDLAGVPFRLIKRLRRDEVELPAWFRPMARSIGAGLVNLWCLKNFTMSREMYRSICSQENFFRRLTD